MISAPTLSPTVSKIVAATLLVIALNLGWVVVVRPVSATFVANREAIAQQRQILARYRKIAARRAALRRQLDEVRRARAAENRLFEGESVEIVGARIQDMVRAVVADNGGRLSSSEVLPEETEKHWRKVSVRVSLIADAAAFVKAVRALEAARPYLFFDAVEVRAQVRPRARGRPPVAGDLQIRWQVYGYMRAAES